MRKERRAEEKKNIQLILNGLDTDERVLKMKNFVQHGRVSTYDHCRSVVQLSYQINRRYHLHADERILLRAAMLHDFFLYDWHVKDNSHRLHGFRHADRAVEHAVREFAISEDEKSVIWSHMWPLNLSRLPRSKEAWIVCLADKLVSLEETLFRR